MAAAALAFLCSAAAADDSKKADPAADSDLLEFLGSVDSGADSQATQDDGSWIDYLAQTDIGKVAKSAAGDSTSQPKPSATGPQPAASGEKKDD
jgi:hypothetical protein